jgi:hypothetical protein
MHSWISTSSSTLDLDSSCSKILGTTHLVSMHLSSFMKFIVENNIVHEDVLMTIFAFSLNGKNAREWYCDFNPKEIKSFPYLVKKFQNYWMCGYGNEDHVTDLYEAYFWLIFVLK